MEMKTVICRVCGESWKQPADEEEYSCSHCGVGNGAGSVGGKAVSG